MLFMVWSTWMCHNFSLESRLESPFEVQHPFILRDRLSYSWLVQTCNKSVVRLIISVQLRWIIDSSLLFAFVVMRLKLFAHLFPDSLPLACLTIIHSQWFKLAQCQRPSFHFGFDTVPNDLHVKMLSMSRSQSLLALALADIWMRKLLLLLSGASLKWMLALPFLGIYLGTVAAQLHNRTATTAPTLKSYLPPIAW